MAGGLGRAVGITLIVLGALALLGGLVSAVVGATQQSERSDDLVRDRDQEEMNEALLVGGLVAAGVGIVVLVAGVALHAYGRSRFEGALLRNVITPTAPPAAPPAAPAPIARWDPDATVPAAGRRGAAASTAEPVAVRARTGGRAGANAIFAAAAVIAVAAVAIALGAGDLEFLRSSEGLTTDTIPPLWSRTFEGTVSAGVVGGVVVQSPASEGSGQFQAHQDARFVAANLSWTPAAEGAEALRLVIEVRDGDGPWFPIARAEGASPLVAVGSSDDLGLASVRYRVEPVDSAVASQEFRLLVELFRGPS